MRSKLNFLINVSLKKKVKSKWFLIANIIVALLIVAVINIDSIITLFGGDFNNNNNIYVIDETNSIYEGFKENLKYYEDSIYGDESSIYNVSLADRPIDELKELLKEEDTSLIIDIYYNDDDISAKLISLSTIDSYDYQLITSALQTTFSMYNLNSINLTEEEYSKLTSTLEIEREILDENITSEDEDVEMIMTSVFPILILPFFMLTIFLIQFIGSEVNDEKSTKSMEIIISSVSPKTHFAAKIISNNLFIIMQVILMIVYASLGLIIRKFVGGEAIVNGVAQAVSDTFKTLTTGAMADKLVYVIIFTAILMILTFIAYSLIAGILASMTTNTEDYQQVQAPIMIVLLLGYYLAIMAGIFKGSLFIKILSFVPLISAVLSPSLLVLGQIGIIEIIISIILMIFTIYFLVKYGLRIYKVGILNYSSNGIWKKIFKSLKNK